MTEATYPYEEKYTASKTARSGPNRMLVLQAIGRWVYLGSAPGNAPVWALNECKVLYEETEQRVRSPEVSGPREGREDGALLELVADLFFSGEKRKEHHVILRRDGTFSDEQVFVAALRALGKADENNLISRSQTRKLRNAWVVDKDRRMERARMRWIAEFGERSGLSYRPSKPRPY